MALASWLRKPWHVGHLMRALISIVRKVPSHDSPPQALDFEPPFPDVSAGISITKGPTEIEWIRSALQPYGGEPNPLFVVGSARLAAAISSSMPVVTGRADNWRAVCESAQLMALLGESTRDPVPCSWRYRILAYPHAVSIGSRDLEALSTWFSAQGAPTIFAYTEDRRHVAVYEWAARHFDVVWCLTEEHADAFIQVGLAPSSVYVAPPATDPPPVAWEQRDGILVVVDTETTSRQTFEAAVGELETRGFEHEEVVLAPPLPYMSDPSWAALDLVSPADIDVGRVAARFDKSLILGGRPIAECGWVLDSLAAGTPVISIGMERPAYLPDGAIVSLADLATPTPPQSRKELRRFVSDHHTYRKRLQDIIEHLGSPELANRLGTHNDRA